MATMICNEYFLLKIEVYNPNLILTIYLVFILMVIEEKYFGANAYFLFHHISPV